MASKKSNTKELPHVESEPAVVEKPAKTKKRSCDVLVKTKRIFVCSDGREFDNKGDAEKYDVLVKTQAMLDRVNSERFENGESQIPIDAVGFASIVLDNPVLIKAIVKSYRKAAAKNPTE